MDKPNTDTPAARGDDEVLDLADESDSTELLSDTRQQDRDEDSAQRDTLVKRQDELARDPTVIVPRDRRVIRELEEARRGSPSIRVGDRLIVRGRLGSTPPSVLDVPEQVTKKPVATLAPGPWATQSYPPRPARLPEVAPPPLGEAAPPTPRPTPRGVSRAGRRSRRGAVLGLVGVCGTCVLSLTGLVILGVVALSG